MKKLVGIQLARAIAALSVCYFHSWTILDRFPQGAAHPIPGLSRYGWLGVDLFFGVSGFVICLVVTRPSFRPTQFLIRRVFRIYPLWLITLSLWAMMAWAWRGLLPTETLERFVYSATLLPTNGFPFYDIGWSLQHEMLFYLIAVAIVPVAGIAGLLAFLCFSAAANQLLPLPWYLAQFASYHAEFLAGALAFLLAPRLRWAGAILPIATGAALISAVLIADGSRLLVAVPVFFFVVGFANVQEIGTLGAVTLGDASYSIYLIHPLVFAVTKSATKITGTSATWAEEPLRFAAITLVICISLLSWRFFERPMIEAGENIAALQNPHDVVA